MLGDSDAGRDAASEVLGRLWENCKPVSLHNVDDYLFICMKHYCLDCLRHDRKVELYKQTALAQIDNTVDFDNYDRVLDTVMEVISGMNGKTRFIMEQCYLHEKTYKEVANIMEMTESGIKKHVIKGLTIIRGVLNVKYKKGRP